MIAGIEMRGRVLLHGPVMLTVKAYFLIPESWAQWKQDAARNGHILHTNTPDLSNIVKNVEDAFNKVVWVDDAQVCRYGGSTGKFYSDQPEVYVEVEELPGYPANIKRRDEYEQA